MKTFPSSSFNFQAVLETGAAWFLALFWIAPLAYAFWAAFHPGQYAVHFDIFAPLTLDNFREALSQAPFLRYAFNTFILVTTILISQLVICTLAAYAFARYRFFGSDIAFALVLVQLMEEAARLEGCGVFGVLWRVYVPLARPTYIAYALVSISHHWNNFLWPLVVTNSVETRPLTVGLGIFGAPESGVDWSIMSAATLMSVAPLLIAFLLFQRQFVQSFMHAGIK